MVRVLHVIGKMDRAGAETMIMNIYRKIDRTKVQFDFLVFSQERAAYDDEIEKLGGKIYRLSAFKGYNYFKVCAELKRFFRKNPYKVVHGHIGSLAPIYLKYAKANSGYAIAHSHGCNSNHFFEKTIYMLFAYRVRYVADYFMACSLQAGIDRFGEKVVESSDFKIIHNGIDSKLYQYSLERHERLKEKFGLKDKMVFGHAGRFIPSKNHGFLLKVFYEVSRRKPDAVLMLAGAGSEEVDIRKRVDELGLQDKVIFLGMRTDMPDILNLLDVFVFPSFHEGLSLAGVEAQAAGLPCFFSTGVVEESVITDNAWRYPLDWGEKKWADLILQEMEHFVRHDTRQDIVRAKYDAEYTAGELQAFYLQHSRIE